MKAISLWQPWASLIRPEPWAKHIETRSWSTNYRGPLAIHAAKRKVAELPALKDLRNASLSYADIRTVQRWSIAKDDLEAYRLCEGARRLPLGAVVATATLAGCAMIRTTEEHHHAGGQCWILPPRENTWEYAWGDYTPGRFAWVLTDIRVLPEPVPCRGAQGLFDVPDDLSSRPPSSLPLLDLV